MSFVWIPGWQFSGRAFQPLWQCLGISAPHVLSYVDGNVELPQWLAAQARQLPDDAVLVGWSLGGMLACELAKQSQNVAKVLVVGTNTQFAGPTGLPLAVAESFMARYRRSPSATRRKFVSLVDRQQAAVVKEYLVDGYHLPTLQWLYQLRILDDIPCPVHVLLAEQDQLVPVTTAQDAWRSIAQSVTTMAGEHSLPLTQAQAVAKWLQKYG